jgi:hypothetical protein
MDNEKALHHRNCHQPDLDIGHHHHQRHNVDGQCYEQTKQQVDDCQQKTVLYLSFDDEEHSVLGQPTCHETFASTSLPQSVPTQ